MNIKRDYSRFLCDNFEFGSAPLKTGGSAAVAPSRDSLMLHVLNVLEDDIAISALQGQ